MCITVEINPNDKFTDISILSGNNINFHTVSVSVQFAWLEGNPHQYLVQGLKA